MVQYLSKRQRIHYLDLIRVLACFMVMMIHVRSAFDLKTDSATQFFIATLRPCVPLFIMISAILLLPLKDTTSIFLRRRVSRVVIPFLIWSILYVFLPTPSKINFGGLENTLTASALAPWIKSLLMIPINFTWVNVHFWFIYTIIGLYLFMPIISPWFEKTTSKGLSYFLFIWVLTTILYYAKIWFPQIHGVCDWNEYGMLYNFSGYLGYLVLGFFLHKYNTLTKVRSILFGSALWLTGAYFTYKGLLFSLSQPERMTWILTEGQKVEFFINNLSINVIMMTAGLFMILQKITLTGFFYKVVREFSKYSYGIFLVHYFITIWMIHCLKTYEMNGILNSWIQQPLMALLVFFGSYLIVKALSYLPKSEYIIG
ncbi:acyltransferase [Halosquirtibacter xylanolyticus]|uniref:acyltransferase n=1 Tax=Halosquirtibacter xylanolyticus TaxID=3374599 RepID=UPI00374844B7|nr:acyltransferase [Prolixibacteraceae bacterium]